MTFRREPVASTEETPKIGARKKHFPALIVLGLVAFGLSSFLLGWFDYASFHLTAICDLPSIGQCIFGQLPLYVFALFFLIEVVTAVFLAFTLYIMIRNAINKIQNLEEKLSQSQANSN